MYKIIAGVGIPVDLELEAVTMGFVFKAGFVLPNNVSQLEHNIADPFDLNTQPIAPPQKRSVEDVRSEGDGDDDGDELHDRSHLATMRWNVYRGLAKYAERYCSRTVYVVDYEKRWRKCAKLLEWKEECPCILWISNFLAIFHKFLAYFPFFS